MTPLTVRVPVEKPVDNGRFAVFGTSDRRVYARHVTSGVIRRAVPKVRGKAARRADKVARRTRGVWRELD